MNHFIMTLFFLASFPGAKSGTRHEVAKSYSAGFRVIHLVDKTRSYRPGANVNDSLYYRPIDLDVWYPAGSSSKDTIVTVHDLFYLLEQRANVYSASTVGNGASGQLANIFCSTFHCSDSARLLQYKTQTIRNAIPSKGKFPVVVYMTAYNGMSYENFTLFEELARKGFVVISISSIGRFPGDMTTKKEDLFEQVDDAVFALNYLKNEAQCDLNKIGIVGYSWGGLAGAALAGKISNARCLISLEGSEFHHYGSAQNEDEDFNNIRNSPEFKSLHLTIPYLRLESSTVAQFQNEAPTVNQKDSVYPFSALHSSSSQIFTVDSAKHEDFGCMSLVVKASGDCTIDKKYPTILKLTTSFLETNLQNHDIFSSSIKQELNKTIKTARPIPAITRSGASSSGK